MHCTLPVSIFIIGTDELLKGVTKRMKLKKVIALLLMLSMVLAFTACNNGDKEKSDSKTQTQL